MAYKVFTNGSPLPASDLNTYLMNQSVMVFANSTARSAALTSPTEGMVTYLEDTNKLEVYTGAAWVDVNDNAAAIPKSTVTTAGDLIVADGNASVTRLGIGANGSIPRVSSGSLGYLPIGTTGQILTVVGGAPTWAAAPSGGNYTLITTATLSSSALSITSIPGTYEDLLMIMDLNGQLDLRMNGYTTGYKSLRISATSTTVTNQTTTAQNTFINRGQVTFRDYANTNMKLHYEIIGADTLNDDVYFINGNNTNGPAAITSITSTNTRTGTVWLYGKNY